MRIFQKGTLCEAFMSVPGLVTKDRNDVFPEGEEAVSTTLFFVDVML